MNTLTGTLRWWGYGDFGSVPLPSKCSFTVDHHFGFLNLKFTAVWGKASVSLKQSAYWYIEHLNLPAENLKEFFLFIISVYDIEEHVV